MIGSLVALISILIAIVVFIIFKHKKHKNNNSRCSLKTPVSENTVSLNLSDVHNTPSGKVLNGHLYNGVAVEETDSDRECYHGRYHMSLVLRKPVFGVSDQVPHKPGCTATKDG